MTSRPSAPLKKLEKDVVRAAMRWAELAYPEIVENVKPTPCETALAKACARLAQPK